MREKLPEINAEIYRRLNKTKGGEDTFQMEGREKYKYFEIREGFAPSEIAKSPAWPEPPLHVERNVCSSRNRLFQKHLS